MFLSNFIKKIADSAVKEISHGAVVVNGREIIIRDLEKETSNGTVTVKYFVDNNIIGHITEYRLKSSTGEILAKKAANLNKDEFEAVLVDFSFNIKEVA